MIPIIYSSSSSTTFTTNGRGQLADAIECTVTEEINGVYQLHLVYPIDGMHADDLKALNIIKAVPAVGKAAQLFDIFRVSMPRLDRFEVDARHVSYRLNKCALRPFGGKYALPSYLFSAISSNSAETYNFTYESDITRACKLNVVEPTSIRKALSMVTVTEQDSTTYSPEFTWDNFNVIMSKQRGTTRNVTVKYGKNLIDYKQEENIEEVITGVLPYWRGKTGGGDEVVVTGSVRSVDMSNFPYRRTVPLDLSSEFKEKPTTTQLNNRATAYLSEINAGVPKVSMDVSFIDLSQSLEYSGLQSLYKADLGDTITIDYEKLGVSTQARITRTVYDVLNERYTEISLGDAKIRGQSAKSAVAPVKQQVAQVGNAVTALTENEESLVTLPSNFTSGGSTRNFYRRKGNICMVGLDCTPSAHVSGQTLFTLPTSCRPVIACRFSVLPGVSRSSDDGDDHYIIVNTDGTVTYTGTGRVFNTFTYICNGG